MRGNRGRSRRGSGSSRGNLASNHENLHFTDPNNSSYRGRPFRRGSATIPKRQYEDLGTEFEKINIEDSSEFSRRRNDNAKHNYDGFKNRRKINLTNEEALKLLHQIENQNSLILEYMENDKLKDLFIASIEFDKGYIFKFLNSINNFIEWNSETNSTTKLFIIIAKVNFVSHGLGKVINNFIFIPPTTIEIEAILSFFINILNKSPKLFFEEIIPLYSTIVMSSDNTKDKRIQILKKNYVNAFNYAKEISTKPDSKNRIIGPSSLKYNGDYREIKVIPGPDDIFCLNEEVFLESNKYSNDNDSTDIAYKTVDEYLDIQFRLLREDFIRPLRESIAKIRENMLATGKLTAKDIQVRIYENVSLEDLLPSRNGIVYKVQFDISKFPAKMDWKKARRFIHGSLLCFTNDLFDSIHFASVIDSDPKHLCKGNLMIQFENDPISEILNNNEFLMLETKNLFEAYRHVLSKLQKFNSLTLPFEKHFVFAQTKIKIPGYMKHSSIYNIETLKDKEMDESQFSAFKNSLTSDISLIQGPPGTGKTYVGLKIINYLSRNFQSSSEDIGPILVVCYTNHALDQFLEEIVSVLGVENILRVGGRSKSECMKQCNINNIKRKWIAKKRFPHYLIRQIVNNRQELEEIEFSLVQLYIRITNLNGRLLTSADLSSCMCLNSKLYFRNIDFDNWLKGSDVEYTPTFTNLKMISTKVMIEVHNNMMDNDMVEILKALVEGVIDDLLSDSNNFEIDVEDPEAFLYDQQFLDEDSDLMKSTNKFKSLYNNNRSKGKLNTSEELKEYSYEFKTVANSKLIKRKLKNVKPLSEEDYEKLHNFDVAFDVRLQLYKYWFTKYRNNLITQYNKEKAEYDNVNEIRKKLSDEEYELIMKEVKVIGMTTTGAARYGSILDRVGCKVVVIEEAAEVLEAHVICSLSEHCKHLIMIGDHKQLRPKVDVYDLEINYNLGISLFERLIANKCQYFTLQYQHRMRPEISKCVKPIYPDLRDSESVFNYLPVAGMNTDLYFFDHQKSESSCNETSYKNDFEADFITNFCRYLINSGNLPNKITILTFYVGQLYNISSRLKNPVFKGVRVCVVDNFQGEENDLIILSLVRSNREANVGFVKSPNRLCVALSRAKRGFYVIGNISMLRRKIPLINDIFQKYIPASNIGSVLPLKCSMHPSDNNFFVRAPEDFNKSCPSQCGMALDCGHSCISACHIDKPSHKKYKCRQSCLKKCQRNLHKCKCICSEKCKCEEEICLTLKCGHAIVTFCFVDNDLLECPEMCGKKLDCGHVCLGRCSTLCVCKQMLDFDLICGHTIKALCGSTINDLKCMVLYEKNLPCDHTVSVVCGTDILTIKCIAKVIRTFDCGHTIASECWRKTVKCTQKISQKLKCGHDGHIICGSPSEIIKCTQLCNAKSSCSHMCKYRCGECLKGRFHQICNRTCKKILKCGHPCQSICHGGPCPPCEQPCTFTCVHNKCEKQCYDICGRGVCLLDCKKAVYCISCRTSKICDRICGEPRPMMCNKCTNVKSDFSDFCTVDPCKCKIRRTAYQPIINIVVDDISLKCQECNAVMSQPYKGQSLKHYNISRFHLFQSLPLNQIENLVQHFKEIKNANIISAEILDEILAKTRKCKIFNNDDRIFTTSCKYYEDIISLWSKIPIITDNPKLDAYNDSIRQSLQFLIKWSDPTARTFDKIEMKTFNTEKSVINLIIEIIQFVYTATSTEYALIFQNSFDLLNELTTVIGEINLGDFEQKFVDIKTSVGKNNYFSKEEEELVRRIINAKDVLKEFHIEHLPDCDKLKEIKNLIRKCHPDKNKHKDAKIAFQILFTLKQKLKI